jgi:hypothetical protein
MDSKNLSEKVEFIRGLLNRPNPKLMLMTQKDYSALPDDLSQELRLIATRSGTGSLEIGAWWHGSPRRINSLLKASRVTICLLCYEGRKGERDWGEPGQ